jgi:hypothetical protein
VAGISHWEQNKGNIRKKLRVYIMNTNDKRLQNWLEILDTLGDIFQRILLIKEIKYFIKD